MRDRRDHIRIMGSGQAARRAGIAGSGARGSLSTLGVAALVCVEMLVTVGSAMVETLFETIRALDCFLGVHDGICLRASERATPRE